MSAHGSKYGKMFPFKGEVHGIKPCSNPTAFNESFAAQRGVLKNKKKMGWGGEGGGISDM